MEQRPKFKPDPQLKLMDQVRQVLRYHHYSYRTEKTYCAWILRYIKYHGCLDDSICFPQKISAKILSVERQDVIMLWSQVFRRL